MNNPIKLALVDDHQIVIDGITAILQNQDIAKIVVTANGGNELLQKLLRNNVDILLTDVMMDEMNGLELSLLVKQQFPHIKIIALSMSGAADLVDEMINKANIDGYLLKQTDKEELMEAITKVYNGGQYFQPKILNALFEFDKIKKDVATSHLTIREIEIVTLMEKDLGNKEIAEKLFLSVRTVETHRKNIFRKTNTNNALSLVKWAYEHKILKK